MRLSPQRRQAWLWGGYYDRTLAKLRTLKKITAVGIAFGVQELLEIPQKSHDEPLDYVLTERDLIFCRP